MSASFGRLTMVLALSAFFGISVRAGNEAIPAGSDLGRLQGRWSARAGQHSDIEVVLDVQGRRVDATITTPTGLRIQVQGEMRIDETVSPRRLDWIKFNGPDQEYPDIPAIYRLEHDRFVVCNGGFRGKRPTEFKSGEGILAQVVTFQRAGTESGEKGK